MAHVRKLEDEEGDLHSGHQILNMGPSHPATHGTVKFLIELDGETIVDLNRAGGSADSRTSAAFNAATSASSR